MADTIRGVNRNEVRRVPHKNTTRLSNMVSHGTIGASQTSLSNRKEIETMNWLNIIPIVCTVLIAIFAGFALWPNYKSAKAMSQQTEVQRDLAIRQAQPNVWAGIEPDLKQGHVFNLVIRNEGPTIARNITVTIDPPIENLDWDPERVKEIQRRANEGIKSLTPGSGFSWMLGTGPEIVGKDSEVVHTITVNAEGPYGPIETLSYETRPTDWALASAQPDGSLHLIERELREIKKELKAQQSIKREFPHSAF